MAKAPANMVKKVCKECPFRRASLPGYLGEASGDPNGFIASHWHGDVRLPCHMAVDWEAADKEQRVLQAPLCRGFVIFTKNAVKWPANEEVAAAREDVTKDDSIFGWMHEFVDHHQT